MWRAVFILVLCALANGASGAAASHAGGRPLPGSEYDGHFTGLRSSHSVGFALASEPRFFKWLGGALPVRCTRDGGRQLLEIDFDFWDKRTIRGNATIDIHGAFSFGITHRADASKNVTYTVWIRGRFDGKGVRGRAHGVSSSDFNGKCRGDRTYTARLTTG